MGSAAGPTGTVTVTKEDILALMEDLAEEFDPEELMERLFVLAKIARSEASIEEHGLIPDEDLDV